MCGSQTLGGSCALASKGLGFRVEGLAGVGLGFRVWGLGFVVN